MAGTGKPEKSRRYAGGAMRQPGRPPPGEELSIELVQRIQDGDRGAWDSLYRRYHDALLFTVRARLGPRLRSRLQSEDVLQSVIKDALGDLARFEPRGAGSLRRWLHACVENKIRARAAYHDAGPRGREEGMDANLDTIESQDAAEYYDMERYGRLESALTRLSEEMREAVILRAVEGLSTSEAAEALGKTPAATSKLYNRAVARLGTMISLDQLR